MIFVSLWLVAGSALGQSMTMSERADWHMRQTMAVLSSCRLDAERSMAAPDTVRSIWGVQRILRQDWSCRYGVLGTATYLAVRIYAMTTGRPLCIVAEDRGRLKKMMHETTVVPCTVFEEPTVPIPQDAKQEKEDGR